MGKNKKHGRNNQLNDMIEWQDKQYTPWQYSQKGKTIPGISGEGNLKLKTIVVTIVGVLVIAGSIVGIITGIMYSDPELSYILLFVIGICVWDIAVHWNKYNKLKVYKEMEKQKRQKKKRKRR